MVGLAVRYERLSGCLVVTPLVGGDNLVRLNIEPLEIVKGFLDIVRGHQDALLAPRPESGQDGELEIS
jgi:hypothetical protein